MVFDAATIVTVMGENSQNHQSLVDRIRQLENERDELHKDVEQLCMQQAGPSYLGIAARMHFQRTAGLEQEIENLKKKLATCHSENQNLQEELSEAYHIKSQLADLYSSEVSKNAEAEKQLKFFQNCVAAAFAERDSAILEAEKAKEKEESLSRELDMLQTRTDELSYELVQAKELMDSMQIDHDVRERQMEYFRKVIDKFYVIRQQSLTFHEEVPWIDKCQCLLHDSMELWSFRNQEDNSVSKYIRALEQEVETLRKSGDSFQSNLRMGMEIENHLKHQVCILEKEKERSKKAISALLDHHSQHKMDVRHLLDEFDSFIKSTVREVEENIRQLELRSEQNLKANTEVTVKTLDESECRDVHVNNEVDLNSSAQKDDFDLSTTSVLGSVDDSKAFAQALQEKVGALLLLSQEEERHLLERNINVALQRKIEELQRNLLQVTHEKVKALMDLAQLKQEYQMLKEKINQEGSQGKLFDEDRDKRIVQERDGRLKNLLKKTYLGHWFEKTDPEQKVADHQGDFYRKKSNHDMDFARMRIENAALKESLESMEHLTSSVRKLHLALLKMQESASLEGNSDPSEAIDDIINEAKLVKTALGSSLPISWSAEVDLISQVDRLEETINSSNEKVDIVSAAGFEMVQLLIFAAQTWKGTLTLIR